MVKKKYKSSVQNPEFHYLFDVAIGISLRYSKKYRTYQVLDTHKTEWVSEREYFDGKSYHLYCRDKGLRPEIPSGYFAPDRHSSSCSDHVEEEYSLISHRKEHRRNRQNKQYDYSFQRPQSRKSAASVLIVKEIAQEVFEANPNFIIC